MFALSSPSEILVDLSSADLVLQGLGMAPEHCEIFVRSQVQ